MARMLGAPSAFATATRSTSEDLGMEGRSGLQM